MGLKNQPEFEAESDDVVAATATETKTETKPENKMNTSIATRTEGAVAHANSKFQLAFSQIKDVFDTATVEGLSMGMPRIKGEQGSCFLGEIDLGDKIRVSPVSWNYRWAIGTGENDSEAKDYFRVSYDNETISGEETSVHDYMAALKADGFDKARKSQYVDLFCMVTWSAAKGDIPVEEQQLAILQMSPTSIGAFMAFCTTRGLLESRGAAKPLEEIEIHAEKRTKGSNKFTNFSFHAPKG
jgi:hypothetical protein